jgi:hypothetical protein
VEYIPVGVTRSCNAQGTAARIERPSPVRCLVLLR